MSPLQQQYPLSPRKFWKKIIPKLYLWVLALVVVIVGCGFLALFGRTPQETSDAYATMWILSAFITALALIVILPYAWYVRVYIRRYYYDANENFVTIKKGVFAPAEIHVQYSKIQDVYVDQDILDRIMGLYDVHLASATATSAMEAHIDGVEYSAAEGLKNLLLEKIRGGVKTEVTQTAPLSSPSTPTRSASITLSESISNTTYPITQAWLAPRAINAASMGAVWATFVLIFLFIPDKHSSMSIMQDMNLQTSVVVQISFLAFIAGFVSYFIYFILWRATYSFEFMPEFITARQGVLSRQEKHVPYQTIQNVSVTQSMWDRLFGIASVYIQNAAQTSIQPNTPVISGNIEIPGQPLEKANHLAELTRGILLTKNPTQTGL